MHNFVSHAIVPNHHLPPVLVDKVAVLEGAVVWLVRECGDVLQQLLLKVLVTYVLPEDRPHSELHLTVREGALDTNLGAGLLPAASLLKLLLLLFTALPFLL